MLSFGLSFVRSLLSDYVSFKMDKLNGIKTFWSSLNGQTNRTNKLHVFPTLYIRGAKALKV